MTKRNPEFGGFSACFAVRAETDRKGKATPPARTETIRSASMVPAVIFQPTPPARTETIHYIVISGGTGDFNPLRPRGRRRFRTNGEKVGWKFQPTPPARTETMRRLFCLAVWQISTHSAREDGDIAPRTLYSVAANFNPLRPRGRRQQYYTKKPTILHHISTIKSHHTPSNHRQPTLHTSKTVLIVQFFRCESPRKFMFASGSHQTI